MVAHAAKLEGVRMGHPCIGIVETDGALRATFAKLLAKTCKRAMDKHGVSIITDSEAQMLDGISRLVQNITVSGPGASQLEKSMAADTARNVVTAIREWPRGVTKWVL